jgi:threonine dehydratase
LFITLSSQEIESPVNLGQFTSSAHATSITEQHLKLARQIISALVAELVLVEEDDIQRAVLTLLEVEKTVVEGAGAAGLGRSFAIATVLPVAKWD